MGAKRFTASKNDKEWCAERSGELRLDDPDMRKIFRTQLIDELLDKHGLPHTRKNRQKIENAYRTCIPGYKCFAKKYLPFVKIGKNKDLTAEFLQSTMVLKKDEELTIHRMKKAIANAFMTADFSAVDTYGKITHPDPKLLNIFKDSNDTKRISTHQQEYATGSDTPDTLADVHTEAEAIISETEENLE